MKSNDILKELINKEENDEGIILFHTPEGILFFDNATESKTFYRYGAFCRDEDIKPLIHIDAEAKKRGITETKLIQVLKAAYKDKYEDAIATMNGLIVVSDEESFHTLLNKVNTYTNDVLKEWYDWGNMSDYLGKVLTHHRIVVLNSGTTWDTCQEIYRGDPTIGINKLYWRGIAQTIIHECAHLMMDTNECISEEMFITDNDEEAIEEFCRVAYDMLPAELQ